MKYKIAINCPDDERVINTVLETAAKHGVGKIGKYTKSAIILKGYAVWQSEENATPFIGKPGTYSTAPSVRIEMTYLGNEVAKIVKVIKQVHPYEEPIIDVIKLEDF